MKKLFAFISVLAIMSFTPVKKKRIVFFGDSITQAGVNEGGYITKLQAMTGTQSHEMIGAGIGGNKVYDLYLRMEEDVLAKKPDVVVIYVGINDVWHKTSGTGTDKDKYERFYMAIIKKLQAQNIQVMVCTPTVIGEKKNNANPQDADLDAYSDVVRKVAAATNSTLIDLRAAFKKYEDEYNKDDKDSGILTTDRVHLNDAGNTLVATTMMTAITGKK
jgi:lysophospholipase L1-like esterase